MHEGRLFFLVFLGCLFTNMLTTAILVQPEASEPHVPREEAEVAELVDALELGSSGEPWGSSPPFAVELEVAAGTSLHLIATVRFELHVFSPQKKGTRRSSGPLAPCSQLLLRLVKQNYVTTTEPRRPLRPGDCNVVVIKNVVERVAHCYYAASVVGENVTEMRISTFIPIRALFRA